MLVSDDDELEEGDMHMMDEVVESKVHCFNIMMRLKKKKKNWLHPFRVCHVIYIIMKIKKLHKYH